MTLDRNNSLVSSVSTVGLIPTVIDYNITQITPYVYVTAGDTAQQFPMIFSNGIACVINVANELPQIVFPPQTGIESLKYPIQDSPTFPVSYYFDTVADRIAANAASNRRTLLYCHHGRSRSITFILAYLIKHHHLPLPTAFALVKQKRQVAAPNVGFWSQLQSYELYQQRRNGSPILQNLQHSVAYGNQVINTIADGFVQVLAQVPIVNTFTNTMHLQHHNSHLQAHHRHARRRPPVYIHPYYQRVFSRTNRVPYF
jgi:hypothetical protein